MPTLHDIESRLACDSILKKWKSGDQKWINKFIDRDIVYSATSKNFPSPDRNFYSPSLKTRIAIEFKPYKRETKRGILTGLGQSIAYLNNNSNSASYLVIPDIIESYPIGDFLEKVFKENIFGQLPIGLITFKQNDSSNVRMRCNIKDVLPVVQVTRTGVDKNYWTFWRDTYPHAVYLILKIASKEKSTTNRSKKIWDKYFDDFYIPEYVSDTLSKTNSKILEWDGNFHKPLASWKSHLQTYLDGNIKNTYHKKFSNFLIKNKIEFPKQNDAINFLKTLVSKTVTDNLYQDYKKNHYISVNHLQLWDHDTKYISPLGEKFVQKIDNGANPMNEFSKIILVRGRHIELIRDIMNIQLTLRPFPSTDENFRRDIRDMLEEKGFIKKNPNRAVSEIRKFLQSELQLWNRFGFIKMFKGNFFNPTKGFVFNLNKIDKMEKSYHNTYDKIEAVFLSDSLQ